MSDSVMQQETYSMAQAKGVLKKVFGYDSFRPMQIEVVEHMASMRDAFVLMPTGGGKSICFQIPALLCDGITIVISPLIALMKDQVENLTAAGVDAAYLNSSLSVSEQDEVRYAALNNEIKLLYVSPERFLSGYHDFFSRLNLALVAIDEAHCISSWGHDFRPEYTKLKLIKKNFPNVPIMALTATADKTTRSDIVSQLGLNDPGVFVSSFDRPNLKLTVRTLLKKREKESEIIEFCLARKNDSGIIYCLSRKSTEQLSLLLQQNGIDSVCYHAGMPQKEREKAQDDFINDRSKVVCATVAFGMGIDKPNVRYVIHYNLPKNIESYYQEIGRGGRDGLDSETILYFNYQDIVLNNRMVKESAQADVNEKKLKRMQQYAEATECRRRVLLSYFSDFYEKDCGNCDNCINPPKRFDGTIHVQKALSALIRINEPIGVTVLINILRGSRNQHILSRGWDKIKTYGAGQDLTFEEWQNYLLQMLNLGLLELMYQQNSGLSVTEYGRKVVFNREKTWLVAGSAKVYTAVKKAEKPDFTTRNQDLFEALRKKRLDIARKEGKPPYVIFGDATLREMAALMPLDIAQMESVSGVGAFKLDKYGPKFIEVIEHFVTVVKPKKASTYQVTGKLLKEGASPEAVAKERNLKIETVFSHIGYLIEKGEDFPVVDYVSFVEINRVKDAVVATGETKMLKPLFEEMNSEVAFHKIRLALAFLKKNNKI